jgi:hypothetical protein
MTVAPAIAAGVAHELGRVAVGYRADLAVFAENPLRLDPEAQAGNPVLATYLDGQRIELP